MTNQGEYGAHTESGQYPEEHKHLSRADWCVAAHTVRAVRVNTSTVTLCVPVRRSSLTDVMQIKL